LAIVAKMLEVFGPDLALGYDIGCRFETTLANSPLGEKARKNNHRCLVGAFHGHAHNRLCQSQFLATYIEGLSLEDLEGCERFFSKSNALASSTRYASTFHRRQAIAEYVGYSDKFETYQNLSMLVFKYLLCIPFD
jgi:Kyakuja-Dileera-Zisupton transposase